MTMGFHGALRATQRDGGLLVGSAANNLQQDFALAWRQQRDAMANDVQLALNHK